MYSVVTQLAEISWQELKLFHLRTELLVRFFTDTHEMKTNIYKIQFYTS